MLKAQEKNNFVLLLRLFVSEFSSSEIESHAKLPGPVARNTRYLAESRVKNTGYDPSERMSVEGIEQVSANFYSHTFSHCERFT